MGIENDAILEPAILPRQDPGRPDFSYNRRAISERRLPLDPGVMRNGRQTFPARQQIGFRHRHS